MNPFSRPQWRITLIYVLTGILWIYLSDSAIQWLFDSPQAITSAQNIKGWFFVLTTALLLFFLIRRHFNALDTAHQEVIHSYDQTIRGWVQLMDLRHNETAGHSQRVARMTVALARLCGIDDPEELRRMERGALLHDIGKIGIPDTILIKAGPLSDEEYRTMQQHPLIAHQLFVNIPFLARCVDIPWCHHEKWDGSGYPQGLAGTDIPVAARLFAVVDVWDALSHRRVYKKAWSPDSIKAHLQAEAGRHFDPAILHTFLTHYDSLTAEPDSALTGATDDATQA